MSIYSVPTALGAIFVLFIGLFVLLKRNKSIINITFFSFCFSVFGWLFGYTIAYSTKNIRIATLFCNLACVSVVFTAPTFYHFTLRYLNLKYLFKTIWAPYLIMIILTPLFLFTDYFLSVPILYFWGYYSHAGLFHPLYLVLHFSLLGFAFFLLYKKYSEAIKEKELYRAARLRYVFLAYTLASFSGIDFMQKYGIKVYPFGFVFVLIFVFITSYAIIKYRLMDITVAITRTGVFIAVYSLVLGVPFAIACCFQSYFIGLFGDNWWLVPMGLLTILATVGPFIYIFINRKAEAILLRTQRQYQNTLRQASSGMIRIRNLRELLNLIVHIITKTVKLESAAIFLLNSENTHYKLAAKRDSSRLTKDFILERNSPLIKQFNLKREPIVYEEIQLQVQDNPRDSKMAALEKQLKEINAAVVVPSFVGNRLLGFLVLGKKLSSKLYSQDDLNVFSVLANQAALAIENAQFYEDIKETQEQLFQAEKMATIGTMADGLSHQINNRFQALSLIAGDSLDIMQTIEDSKISSKVKDSLSQLKHAFERIQANVIQGGEIVKGLLKYSRPGQRGFEFVNFNKIVDGALEMVQYKVRLQELDIERRIPKDLPKLKCNLTQLEEVFFNLIDNAYDAIKERKEITAEQGFKGNIIISAVQKNEYLWITFQDNGIGFKDKDKEKVFTPFFTTKATSKKGTGLGLYVIQKIVNFHNGTVSLNSTYNKGTKFEIVLPLSKK
ncbi:MAG: GAF domain-containing protein [Candidatus Omnitrophica bacterium]|nr:GAF domain-containing protein [Candidatus Omnitrophota bacterium]